MPTLTLVQAEGLVVRTLTRNRTSIDNALILTSATPGKVVEDSAGKHSVLIGELLNHINSKTVGAEAAFYKTRVAVSKASDGEQVPAVSSSLLEDVRFGSDG